ncbi:MerR family transcriptional regulator [Nocardiopsis sp. MG754419]|uniref:MerR family transcriptional regulator n=1 Tax=Nocardiopsis sp. MG754419 TaxID=2259865 RepID=UPI001BA441BF|nr:MerR family transcriptional regulator [Nocardiopsis sp. MG754419]MBR8745157.1 MerR family transcriptional regulator [Nocardiopsis sp. MG754419]
MKDYFTPGEIAQRFDLTLDTLRYYEKAGLLRRVDRAPGGHRRYRADDVELLHLVRCLRDTDMPIARLREFAELVREGDHTIPARVEVLQSHQHRLSAHIDRLRERQEAIRHKIDYYLGVLADHPELLPEPASEGDPRSSIPSPSTVAAGEAAPIDTTMTPTDGTVKEIG